MCGVGRWAYYAKLKSEVDESGKGWRGGSVDEEAGCGGRPRGLMADGGFLIPNWLTWPLTGLQ